MEREVSLPFLVVHSIDHRYIGRVDFRCMCSSAVKLLYFNVIASVCRVVTISW